MELWEVIKNLERGKKFVSTDGFEISGTKDDIWIYYPGGKITRLCRSVASNQYTVLNERSKKVVNIKDFMR